MTSEWDLISENLWLALSEEALRHVSNIVVRQAETLTDEMAADDGPRAALRLLATVLRATIIGWPEPAQRLH